VYPELAALMFPALFVLVFVGIPVSFSLIATAFTFGYVIFGTKIGIQTFGIIEQVSTNYLLSAIPLFVLMGAILERSGISKRLFEAMQLWVGRLPGGLAIATIVICAIFAASAGIVGAVEVVVGIMAIPAMSRHHYEKRLITGTICAGGSLGTIIPPSVIVIIYASLAQMSVGRLFAGILIPGLIMVVLFIAYVLIRCAVNREYGPPIPADQLRVSLLDKIRITATALVPAVALIFAVLGTILAGIASPTEAAGVGAFGALLLTIIYGRFSWQLLGKALKVAIKLTAMILLIVVGGVMFTSIFIVMGGGRLISDIIAFFEFGPTGIIALFLFIVFLAGFVLDWTSVVLIVVPIFTPIIKEAGIDPIWFAVMLLVTIQTAYLTPPMAPSIFYLRGVAPDDFTYHEMYAGIIPFVVLQLLTLAIVAMVPSIATYLPGVIVGF
jgi:tripartite ATP-independent transporter DctM subunit